MNHFFLNMSYWVWIALAITLFIIEIVTNTGFLLGIGISSLLVGFVLFLFSTISMSVQIFIFSVLSILTASGWMLYVRAYPAKRDKPRLNRRAEQYIEQVFILQSPLVNGLGKIHVDDTMWQVKCKEDLPAGTSIKVIGVDSVILLVEKFTAL